MQEALHGPAKSLDAGVRSSMESRFGYDFGAIRVHDDAHAAASAREIHASAYTFGNDVVFGAGQYRPGVREGDALIAHELTHVVQQRSAGSGATEPTLEDEADRAANAVRAGSRHSPSALSASGERVLRQETEDAPQNDCAGQESDCQSMISSIVRRTLRNLNRPPTMCDLRCTSATSGQAKCAGEEIIVSWDPATKTATAQLIDSFTGLPIRVCTYSYTCPSSGGLVLGDDKCS